VEFSTKVDMVYHAGPSVGSSWTHYAWYNGSHTQEQHTLVSCALRRNFLSLFSVCPAWTHIRNKAYADKHTTQHQLLSSIWFFHWFSKQLKWSRCVLYKHKSPITQGALWFLPKQTKDLSYHSSIHPSIHPPTHFPSDHVFFYTEDTITLRIVFLTEVNQRGYPPLRKESRLLNVVLTRRMRKTRFVQERCLPAV
jgi:hypothetical protein